MRLSAVLLTAFLTVWGGLPVAAQPAFQEIDGGALLPLDVGTMRVTFCGTTQVHVTITPEGAAARPSLVVPGCQAPAGVRVDEQGGAVVVQTDVAAITVDRQTGALVVEDGAGRSLVRARAPTAFEPVKVGDEPAWAIRQQFALTEEEGLYGLGEFQNGVLNRRGESMLLAPSNTRAPIPFVVSTKGWGILWDNTSVSHFEDGPDGMAFSSEVANGVDYYVAVGATPEDAIAGYRQLTGKAPMYPRWAYGYWQSKERYKTQQELIDVVDEYRRRHLPLDAIVQDWKWWPTDEQFSGMVWDSTRYPDPSGLVDSLQARNAHLMVSVWPAVGVGSAVHDALKAEGHLYPNDHWSPSHVYDAYSAEGRATYFRYARQALTDHGVEGWWMDGSEPEFRSTDDRYLTRNRLLANGENALGSLARYATTYSLVHAGGVYDHLREATPDKRPYILTRSAFAGQQRYGATLWSGDLYASWQVFRQQIAAGLGASAAGYPYWASDIGGFFTFTRFPEGLDDPAYRELYTRWFQFGAFSPIFRSHGTDIPREIWRFGEPGDEAYDAIAAADRLRYRLLPYLYTEAARVERDGASIMRALPLAFPDDPRVRDVADTYLFGPSLLVHPVTLAMRHAPVDQRAALDARQLLDPTGTRPGFDLSFYRGTAFDSLVSRRLGETLQLTWTGSLPAEIAEVPYSLRAEGALRVDTTGTYEMVATVSGGLRLWVDGERVIDAWDNDSETMIRGTVDLRAGSTPPFRIEYRQPNAGQAKMTIEWVPPGWSEVHPTETWPTVLPAGTGWVNFWTGETRPGSTTDVVAAPLDQVPLYVPAGTVLPLGPDVQHSGQELGGPLEVRIYPGADGRYALYNDAGDGFGYRRGERAEIPFVWDDDARTLTVGARRGTYPGMPTERMLRIVVVRPGYGVGVAPTTDVDREIRYDGRPLTLTF